MESGTERDAGRSRPSSGRRWRRCCGGRCRRGCGSGWRWSRRPWLGGDVAAIARWSGRTPGTVRRWLAGLPGGRDRGAGRRSAPGATPESRCDVSGRAGDRRWRRRRGRWACPSMSGPPVASATISRSRPACASPPAGCGCCCTQQHFACGRPKHTLDSSPRPGRSRRLRRPPCGRRGKKVRAPAGAV